MYLCVRVTHALYCTASGLYSRPPYGGRVPCARNTPPPKAHRDCPSPPPPPTPCKALGYAHSTDSRVAGHVALQSNNTCTPALGGVCPARLPLGNRVCEVRLRLASP